MQSNRRETEAAPVRLHKKTRMALSRVYTSAKAQQDL